MAEEQNDDEHGGLPPIHDDSASVESSEQDLTGSEISGNTVPSKEEQEELAKAETRKLFWLRLIVLGVMVVSTVGAALAVYFYVSNSEEEEFEEHFTDAASKVFEAIGSTLALSLGALDTFAVNQVSFARYTNETWPLVTFPDYAIKAAKIRSLSKAILVSQYHLVRTDDKAEWEKYSIENDAWVEEGMAIQKEDENFMGTQVEKWDTLGSIHGARDMETGPFLPKWQSSPIVPVYPPYNWDILSIPGARHAILDEVLPKRRVVIPESYNLGDPNDPEQVLADKGNANWLSDFISKDEDPSEPATDLYYPILDTMDAVRISDLENQDAVGIVAMTFFWRDLIKNILPDGTHGIIVVFGNDCNQTFTYQINGAEVEYLGRGDLHDPSFEYLEHSSNFIDLKAFSVVNRSYSGIPLSEDFCPHWARIYPSEAGKRSHTTSNAAIFTVTVVLIFVFASAIFVLYDWLVERRQRLVMRTAVQSSAIVSSLFPSTVRDRLFPSNEKETGKGEAKKHTLGLVYQPSTLRLRTYLSNGASTNHPHDESETKKSKPIADLFPETTIMFADIAGFTAWSSAREPAQVFTLLEVLYGAFDVLAKKRGVFKVETVGDCYVAVVGLPEPRKHHAVVMARFARDCRHKMTELARKLEVELGPETADLQMRFGLHSGPVTAGVLRGDRTRFQLFGDSVNTAARMESTGQSQRIQVSQSTADLLIAAGKGHWVKPREDLVQAKGKGMMQTYWIEPATNTGSVATSEKSHPSSLDDSSPELVYDKNQRLIDWNADILVRLIRQVLARRKAKKPLLPAFSSGSCPHLSVRPDETILDEVKEIIELPAFDKAVQDQEDPDSIQLSETLLSQIGDYVTLVATTYRDNPFHNFEHASHVTMSVVKLLSRIVAPNLEAFPDTREEKLASTLHDHTYGITSDPLTQFACVFAALIHDVDHAGVPNAQLVKERAPIATVYKNKAVAEQNSVEVAWALFMDRNFDELRAAICPTDDEMSRLRQLVVNSVMATDIVDKELKALRNARWEKAFQEGSTASEENPQDTINRKATIVIEHLIQASDIAHTMQHWHIYRKWNERLFEEVYVAYIAGRADTDPTEIWYEGELGFFDFYIIPLAKKLKDCGVFGVSSDEYLLYAQRNRQEWEERGQEVVSEMSQRLKSRFACGVTPE